MSNSVDLKTEQIDRARAVLGGQSIDSKSLVDLAKELKNFNEFGYARKLFDRARTQQGTEWNDEERLELAQLLALCIYKDPDLPADQKYVRALEVLRKECNLAKSTDPETCGLAGAIFKRRWEMEGQRQFLERSCYYYLKACRDVISTDPQDQPGYNEINAAFVLDLLADLEIRAIDDESAEIERVKLRKDRARELREGVIRALSELKRSNGKPDEDYWIKVTLAEAAFGPLRVARAQMNLALVEKAAGRLEVALPLNPEAVLRALRAAGYAVQAVDTTGAGDVFNGALAVALSEGRLLRGDKETA